MPTDSRTISSHNADFDHCIDEIERCIQVNDCDYVIIGGDLNVDLQRRSANLRSMIDCAFRNNLKFMWDHNMHPDTVI